MEAAPREAESFTHEDLMDLTSTTLTSLLESDSVLSDLPAGVTLEEVAAQIALAQGQSITVTVCKDDGTRMPVVVDQKGTVLDLKRAIQRHTALVLSRAGRAHVKVNWRYVWRTNWLSVDGVKLMDDNVKLANAGVRNRCSVVYVKRVNARNSFDN